MEHDNSHGVGSSAIFSGGVGTFDTVTDEKPAPTTELELPSNSLRQLAASLESASSTNSLIRYRDLNLEQLEMFEAELRNQGIVPGDSPSSFSIAQHAVHYAAILRWRAARIGITPPKIDFRVDLPRYILARAEEISSSLAPDSSDEDLLLRRTDSWGRERETRGQLLQQAEYLGHLAGFLIGQNDHASNRYERGLSVVLRAVSSSADSAPEQVRDGLEVSLPMTVASFLQLLRSNDSATDR